MKKKFAIPVAEKQFCDHFGHCEEFAIVESNDGNVAGINYVEPPMHQPGAYPRFLAEQGVNTIIAGGMGMKAQQIFTANHIEVIMGVIPDTPEKLVDLYLAGELDDGKNRCDHPHGHHHH